MNKLLVLSTTIIMSGWSLADGEVLILTGQYTGKNLYVQNPILPDNRFSTEEVFVNETLVLSNPMTSAYTIDLSHLRMEQQVEIRIVHKKHFKPRIINAHVIRDQKITVSESYAAVENIFRWINVDGTTIRWLTHGEKGGGTFEIQRAVKEKWQTLDRVAAIPEADEFIYRFSVDHQQGYNTYRIKLVDRDGYVTYSNLINYNFK